MKTKLHYLLGALALLAFSTFNSELSTAQAQGTAFTYQGHLNDGANPANGSYNLTFSLFNAGSGGSQVGSTLTFSAVGVTNGLFTVTVDFGAVFNGTAYWLQIGVCTNGSSTFVTLGPLQELTPVPYAVTAENLLGVLPLAQLPPTVALLNDPGTRNFFGGQNAGNPTLSGTDNTGVGFHALAANTSGSGNTANGVGALGGNLTGSANAAFGADALAFNNSGSNNVATGANALGFNSSGSGNTAVGMGALAFNGAASGNTAVGFDALSANQTGYNNTAEGYEAVQNNMAGADNVGVGVASFQALTAGSGNTAIGTYAFQLTTAGDGNVGLGYSAGKNLVSGTNNIYIGNAGASAENNVIRIGTPGTQTSAVIAGSVEMLGGGRIDDNDVYLRTGNDVHHGLGYRATVSGAGVDGPFLYGWGGGVLGTTGGQGIALQWDDAGSVSVNNNLSTATLTIRGGADVAEPFPVTGGHVEPGTVMVIDETHPGQLSRSARAYDTRVAGVISGAGGVKPGLELQQEGVLDRGQKVALSGRVYVRAEASRGAIRPGDLLTTSALPGCAMKVTDHLRAQGAILGKAMTGLTDGRGLVLVLVTLQ